MKACITNIQRFSIHDGPGIRTTVFFKGCNLRCLWCHNPETHRAAPERMFFAEKCVNCGACRQVCDKMFTSACTACGRCVKVCRHGALEISGKEYTPEELTEALLRDKAFYEMSGGGVTFSGGEPLLYPEFLREVLGRCKEEGIHTAIETAGNVRWEVWESVLPLLDFIHFDIKAIREDLHRELTGVSPARIQENARRIMERVPSERLLFRMPYVPGMNDAELPDIVRFIEGRRLELMPYHNIMIGKYHALGRPYGLEDVRVPGQEEMQEIASRYPNVFCEENPL